MEQEAKFVFALKNAVNRSPSEVPELLKPHLGSLEMAFKSTEKFPAQPNGTLPEGFFKVISNQPDDPNSPGIRMNQARYLGISEDRIFDQRAAYNGVAFIARTQAEMLEGILAIRVNELPSPVDAMIYEAMLTGLADNASSQRADSSGQDEAQPGSGAVRQMATGKNPIYRLVAVEQANRLNTADRLNLYKSFIEEKDPQIRQRAIEGIAQLKSNEAITVLRRFEKSSIQQGDQESADLASQAIKRLEAKSP